MKKAQRYNELVHSAQLRSSVYGILSLIYRQEVTEDLIEKIRDPSFLETLSELGLELDNEFKRKPKNELLLDLQTTYTKLFLGPGKHILACESAHRKDDTGSFWGEATPRVKRFIEATGLEFKKGYGGIPDHISIELEFMQRLTQKESLAWKKKDHDLAVRCLEVERSFMNEHLSEWVPEFCHKVTEESENSFYKQMAKLTEKFIRFDKEEIRDVLSRIERDV